MDNSKSEKEIDFNVANALYLMSATLGENYEKEKLSPFDDGFVLTDELAEKILRNNAELDKVVGANFLENGNFEVSKKLKNSLEVTANLIDTLKQKMANGEFQNEQNDNVEMEIKNVITLLSARKKMLEISIERLKKSNENSFNLYKDILATSKRIEELLQESYEEKIKMEEVVINLVEFARREAKMRKLRTAQVNNLKAQVEEKIKEKTEEIKKEIEKEKEIKIEKEKAKESENKSFKNSEKIEKIEKNEDNLIY